MYSFLACAYNVHNETGHPYGYFIACQKAVEKTDNHFHAYISKSASLPSIPHSWKLWFRYNFAKECRAFFREGEGKRIFFLESFHRIEFQAFALSALLLAGKHDRIWIVYRDELSSKHIKLRIKIFFLTWLLRFRFGNRFCLFSDSRYIARYLSRKYHCHVTYLPFPNTDLVVQPFGKSDANPIRCSWPGYPNPAKGERVICQLVQSEDPKACYFSLDVNQETKLPSNRGKIAIFSRKAHLSRSEYLTSLNQADVVWLPYDGKIYRWRTSGIFVEAVLMGKIPLVQKGSWLALELKRYKLNELIVDWNSNVFFSRLHVLLNEPEIYRKLQTMQDDYRSVHSLERFNALIKEQIEDQITA